MQFGLFNFEEQLQELQIDESTVDLLHVETDSPALNSVFASEEELSEPSTEVLDAVLHSIEDSESEETAEVVDEGPAYRERDWILEQSLDKPGSVTITRVHRKHAVVVPLDLDAALMLHSYGNSEAEIVTATEKMENGEYKTTLISDGSNPGYKPEDAGKGIIRACLSKVHSEKEFDNRQFFPFQNLIGQTYEDSFLYLHMAEVGFNIVPTPSVARWVKKEFKREKRELTPFDLPEIKDNRPLFDQMEEGLMVVCLQDIEDFANGERYICVKTTDKNGSDNGVQLQKLQGYGEDSDLVGQRLVWSNTILMEDFFCLEAGLDVVYDRDKSIVTVYQKEFEAQKKKLIDMGLDLYDHTVYDAAQSSLKRNVLNSKPQRMGKTSEAIATALLYGSEKIGVISPSADTREEFRSELERLKIYDYTYVDSVEDLKKQARWYLMDFGTLKGLEKDEAPPGNYKYEIQAKCPLCNDLLMRFEPEYVTSTFIRWKREVDFGYRCDNPNCSGIESLPLKKKYLSRGRWIGPKPGASWFNPDITGRTMSHSIPRLRKIGSRYFPDPSGALRTSSGYVDYERAKMAQLYLRVKKENLEHGGTGEVSTENKNLIFRGRMNQATGFVKDSWSPARYKKLKDFFGTIIVDEIHILARGLSTGQGRAVFGMRAKHKISLTGTLMPNGPTDPYWPCHWTFGGGSKLFPYFRSGKNGFTKYSRSFCKNVTLTNAQGQKRSKKLPIATAPLKQRKLHAPLIIRRTFNDSLVRDSLVKKGFHYPKVNYNLIECDPDPFQAQLLVNAMDKFEQAYNIYQEQQEELEKDVNAAYVLSSMSMLKAAATVPDFLNNKLAALGSTEKIYLGVPGGGKTKEIRNIVYNTLERGEKVLVLSFYRDELKVLQQELADFKPTLYDTDWNKDQRLECRQAFLNDPNCRVLLGSISALQVGFNLAAPPPMPCNTVICADLLWSPGKQDQAVARILKPLQIPRECDIYYCVLKHSLDKHVFNTFYAKRIASEQVMDGIISTPRPKNFDVKCFVDQVLSERSFMEQYALNVVSEEINYFPLLDTLSNFEDRE